MKAGDCRKVILLKITPVEVLLGRLKQAWTHITAYGIVGLCLYFVSPAGS